MSSTLAPIALIGGWSLAAARQPAAYDSLHDTISALAEHGAADRWIMTTGLAVLGACHLATATGFTELGRGARVALGIGGVATVTVALLPQPDAGHVPAATVGFVALAVWPAISLLPPRRIGTAASAFLFALLGWLAVDLRFDASLGVSERVLAGAEAFTPLAMAVLVLSRRRGRLSPSTSRRPTIRG